jgi:hypothetical protein
MHSRTPDPAQVKPDTPLRLDVAAALAFPDGSMKASGLRKEAGRGRLVVERIAGKDYTTLANVERAVPIAIVVVIYAEDVAAKHARPKVPDRTEGCGVIGGLP